MRAVLLVALMLCALPVCSAAVAAEQATEGPPPAGSLAEAAQNPVADLISLPFQFNFNFGVGTGDDTQTVLNIQPVIPTTVSPEWNLVTRTIVPVIWQPEIAPGTESATGLGTPCSRSSCRRPSPRA